MIWTAMDHIPKRVLSVLADPSRIEAVPALRWAYDWGGFESDYAFLLALGLGAIAVIVIANLGKILQVYARTTLSLLDWGATRILSNSQAALDNFHGPNLAQSKKFAVIPNGVDTDRFKQHPHVREEVRKELCIPKDAQVIGHIGRVDPAKDHETLIAVVARLRQSHDNLELLLAGTDTDSAAFEQRLERAGIRAITHALGVRSDVDRLYQAMDVFLFPSLTEGQPNALIEAMLSGVQVVATDIPGIRTTVPPCLVSRLFPPKDIPAASQLVATTLSDCNPVPGGARFRALAVRQRGRSPRGSRGADRARALALLLLRQ